MNCQGVCRLLSAYVDGDISPLLRSQIEDHLAICHTCRTKLGDLRLIIETARELEPIEPGSHFVNRLFCALAASRHNQEFRATWGVKLALSGSSFVLAAVATILIFGHQPGNSPPTTQQSLISRPGIVQQRDDHRTKHGFPVPEEALRRDMAAADSVLADTVARPIDVTTSRYFRQVDQLTQDASR